MITGTLTVLRLTYIYISTYVFEQSKTLLLIEMPQLQVSEMVVATFSLYFLVFKWICTIAEYLKKNPLKSAQAVWTLQE